MSALRDAMSHAVLGWVKPELDETLRQARGEVEAFAEDPADTSRMRFCAGYLHQVQGTLRMVELYAPAMVAEEMELLAQALQQDATADRDEACATLMRCTVLLPDYLERVQNGHRDIPIVLLPLLNDLRAARGVAGLNEDALRKAFDLDAALAPSEAEIDHARGSLSGRNRDLLNTVGGVVKDELLRVKDALDLHLRTGGDAASLQPQADELVNVADTLGMLGLGVAREVVLQQREALDAIARGERPASESALLDVAGALLYVDASLDDQVSRLGGPGEEAGDDASSLEAHRTMEVLAHEAIANFATAREHFVAFIETNWDHQRLVEVPRLLSEVSGALRILDLAQPADYLEGVRLYVATELLQRRRVPSGRQLDTLADAMASLEYYLEALRDRRPNRDDILEITRTSLESLYYWPLPEAEAMQSPAPAPAGEEATAEVAEAVAEAPMPWDPVAAEHEAQSASVDDAPSPPQPEPLQAPGLDVELPAVTPAAAVAPPAMAAAAAWVAFDPVDVPAPADAPAPVETPAPAEVTAAPAATAMPLHAVVGGFDEAADIDADIREVFLEEFDEERVNLERMVPHWQAVLEDMDRLRPIRRVFHTLKGSGRLVGARALGEFSWKVEGMLNRVLDGTRPPSQAVSAMVQQACEVLPQFDAALRGQGSVTADLHAMEKVADRIAAGEEAFYTPVTAAVASTPAVVEAVAAAALAMLPGEGEGTPASVDSVLREILEAEVAQHLETVDAWVAAARQAPAPVNEALLRAIHTMNGAFAMTDVPEITTVTQPAETYVRRSLGAAQEPTADGVEALAGMAAAIRTCMHALQSDSPRIPGFASLAERLRALADSLPEAPAPQVADIDVDGEEADAEPAVDLTAVEDLTPYLAPEAVAETPAVDAVEEPDTGESASDAAFAAAAAGVAAAGVGVAAFQAAPVDGQEAGSTAASADADVAGFGLPEIETPEAEAIEVEAAETETAEIETVEIGSIEVETIEVETLGAETLGAETLEAEALEAEALEAEALEAEALEAETLEVDAVEDEAPDVEALEAETATVESVEAIPEEADTTDAAEADVDSIAALAGVVAAGAVAADAGVPALADPEPEAVPEAVEAAAETKETIELPALGEPLPEFRPAEEIVAEGPMLDFNELDRELVDIFVEEGVDLLDHIDGLLQELRADPTAREPIIGLQRDLHTIKGGARMAGIATIGDLGHVIESLLEAAAEHRTELGRDDVRLLERGFDTLHRLLQQTRAHRVTEMPQALIDQFEARIRGEAPVAVAEDAADAIEETAEAATDFAPAPVPVRLSTPLRPMEGLSAPIEEEAAAAPAEDGAPRPAQEQVRVRADLLDNLVNHAGEVAIYRSRLEQQLGAFRSAMAELDRTNARLRDQLRRLDLETEAQIVARYQREQDSADPTFDPLELDRFSTLQQLSRALNESAADLTGLQGVLDDLARQYDVLLQQQSRVSSELQDGLMSARMVPFDSIVPRLRRVVRQAAHDTRKQVQLKLDGTHGELDRNVLDRMVAPLEHMLRNSVAHGLESTKDRRAAKKDEEGSITIALRREGSEIVLQVSDDGRGLDREAIRRRAEQRGLVKPDAELSEAELDSVIFESGFSTSEKVSQLAGRGVGMDVVRNEVRQLGGTVDIQSVTGKGATFTLRLPQTLAVTQAVFVQIGDTTFAVPVASVGGIGRISRERFEAGGGVYRYAGEEYALHDLGVLVGQGAARAEGQAQVPLLLVRAGDLRAAVAIDQVVGNREIVVKPVGLQVASVPGIYGATITGDGQVVVILDVAPLVRRHLAQPDRPVAVEAPQARHVPLVMVVDDSLTMRKVTGRVLERHNFEVVVARDGVEALERLEERVPDLMLLDIEMPRMDGYELATVMRGDDRFRGVPIVMITSRTGEKHRQRALEIGVQRYLGKPYQELDLMRNVYDLLGIARARG